MRHDYKYLSNQEAITPSKFRPEKSHVLLVSAIAAGLVLGFSLLPNKAGANKNNIITASTKKIEQAVPQVKSQRIIESLPLPEEPHINSLLLPLNEPVSPEQEKSLSWKTVKIKSGDTMAGIFSRQGISASVLHQIVNLDKNTRRLAKIRPGNSIRFQFDEQGTLHQLLYKYDIANSLQIKKAGTGYNAEILTKSLECLAHPRIHPNWCQT